MQNEAEDAGLLAQVKDDNEVMRQSPRRTCLDICLDCYMYLYHYYDKSVGPFRNISDLSDEAANRLLQDIRATKPISFCAQRNDNYMALRRHYETILRDKFLKKGGIIRRHAPHYMVVEHSPWLASWYENDAFVRIPIEEFDLRTISFTYGDSHKMLYTYEEILDIIAKYGLPQDWNNDGRFGPERYIEAHIWSDETIERYK